MKMKRIITSAVSAVSANALVYPSYDKSSDEYCEVMNGYTEVDDYGIFESVYKFLAQNSSEPYKLYARENGGIFIYEQNYASMFSFTVPTISDVNEYETVIQAILDKFDPSYEVSSSITATDDGKYGWKYTVTDNNLNSDTLRNAMKICGELKGQGLVDSFTYLGTISTPVQVQCPYLLSYDSFVDGFSKDELEEYVTSHSIGTVADEFESEEMGILPFSDNYCVIPDEKLTIQDQLALAKQIKDDLGSSYSPAWRVLTDLSAISYAETNFDLYNAKYGDANNDGTINAVDASMILTYYAEVQTGGSAQRTSGENMSISLLGDFNNDGVVNAVDASAVLTYYAEEQTK